MMTVGRDEYDREWRVAASGVEHIQRPDGSDGGGMFRMLALSARGRVRAYCGHDITALAPSASAGRTRPCVSCLRAEFADD